MQEKLGIKLQYTPLYSPQTNGLCERQNSTIKTSLKAALIEMGQKHQGNWYNYLPWILLMKRASYQKELDTSPSMLVYGADPVIPGDCLINPGDDLALPDLKQLAEDLTKLDLAAPRQTSSQSTNPVEEPPSTVTHVYVREHGTKGLDSQFRGPFAVVDRPSRSTVKIRVGFYVNGEPRHQIRHWRDLKVAHMRSGDTTEASRAKLGRPKKSSPSSSSASSEADSSTGPSLQPGDAEEVNKLTSSSSFQNQKPATSPLPAEIQNQKPVRSTRNQNPQYIDSLVPNSWAANKEELAAINSSIRGV